MVHNPRWDLTWDHLSNSKFSQYSQLISSRNNRYWNWRKTFPLFIWGLATSHSTVFSLGRMLSTAAFNVPCLRNRAQPLQTASLASFWYWDRHMLIWCFGGSIWRQKTLVFWNNAEQNKLTALNNNGKISQETRFSMPFFFFLRRAWKTCKGFSCALANYLWAIL